MISVVCSYWFRWCTRWSAVCSCWFQSHIRWFVVCRCRFSWKWILGCLLVAGLLVSCCRFQLEVFAVAACTNCFHLRTQWFAAYNCWSRWCTRWVAVLGTIFKRNLPHSSYFWGHSVRSASWCIAVCSCWSRWCIRWFVVCNCLSRSRIHLFVAYSLRFQYWCLLTDSWAGLLVGPVAVLSWWSSSGTAGLGRWVGLTLSFGAAGSGVSDCWFLAGRLWFAAGIGWSRFWTRWSVVDT